MAYLGKTHTGRIVALAAMLAAIIVIGLQGSWAAAAAEAFGKLDTTFGGAGAFTVDLGGKYEKVTGLVVQQDGKIVAAGTTDTGHYAKDHFTLLRFNVDGTLDKTFGDEGVANSNLVPALENDIGEAFALALQPDGKILAAGEAMNPQMYHRTIAIARYNIDGSLDTTFGDGGATLTAVYPETGYGAEDVAKAIAIAPDGKIVVAGLTGHYMLDNTVVRYNPDGSLDTTFGNSGKVVIDLGAYDDGSAVQVQPDGKILLAGAGQSTGSDFTIIRYNYDGSLDQSFGKNGRVDSDFVGGADQIYGLALRPDGKIIAGGSAENYCVSNCARYVFAMAQYNSDGSLDTNFGVNGQAYYDLGAGHTLGAYALTRRADGKLVLAGHLGEHYIAVGLYNADGSPDNSFDEDGLAIVGFGEGRTHAYAVAVQPDGNIVAAGEVDNGINYESNYDFALARFLAPSLPAPSASATATPLVATPTTTPLASDQDCDARLPVFLAERLRRYICQR